MLGPLDAERVVLAAKLANESIAYGLECAFAHDPAETTVVAVDVGPRTQLRLSEEGRPCAGVTVAFGHGLGPEWLDFTYSSDEDGLVRLAQLGREAPDLFFDPDAHEQGADGGGRVVDDGSGAVRAPEAVRAAVVVDADPDGQVGDPQADGSAALALGLDGRHKASFDTP